MLNFLLPASQKGLQSILGIAKNVQPDPGMITDIFRISAEKQIELRKVDKRALADLIKECMKSSTESEINLIQALASSLSTMEGEAEKRFMNTILVVSNAKLSEEAKKEIIRRAQTLKAEALKNNQSLLEGVLKVGLYSLGLAVAILAGGEAIKQGRKPTLWENLLGKKL